MGVWGLGLLGCVGFRVSGLSLKIHGGLRFRAEGLGEFAGLGCRDTVGLGFRVEDSGLSLLVDEVPDLV